MTAPARPGEIPGAHEELAPLCDKLGHTFNDPRLLRTALTHRSYANEHPEESPDGTLDMGHNDRLEFLGDAVLGLSIGHLLMRSFPSVNEGELSKLRARIVSERSLAAVAADLGLGAWLKLGKGEEQGGGRNKPSLLADALEAVLGAIYLDAGFERARAVVERHFLDRVQAASHEHIDFKTALQERCQRVLGRPPTYRLVEARGPDHAKTFVVSSSVNGRELGRGEGRSKKLAEQAAARQALDALAQEQDPSLR